MKEPTRQMTINAETTQKVLHHIQAIYDLLPRLVTLTDESREEITEMGQKIQTFTQIALNLAKANPDIVKNYMKVNEMESDWTSMINLNLIRKRMEELHQQVIDTAILSGYEAYMSALIFYKITEQLSEEDHNKALAIFDELHQHFPGRPKTTASVVSSTSDLSDEEKKATEDEAS